MNVESEITLTLDIRLDVRHFEMVVDPVYDEVGEPRVLPTNLEEFIEKLEAFLSKVVAKDFETHQGLVIREGLSEESESHVIDLIISHIQVNETFVDCYSLGDSFRSVVTALVVCKMQ